MRSSSKSGSSGQLALQLWMIVRETNELIEILVP
jgi:hypothetical protein